MQIKNKSFTYFQVLYTHTSTGHQLKYFLCFTQWNNKHFICNAKIDLIVIS